MATARPTDPTTLAAAEAAIATSSTLDPRALGAALVAGSAAEGDPLATLAADVTAAPFLAGAISNATAGAAQLPAELQADAATCIAYLQARAALLTPAVQQAAGTVLAAAAPGLLAASAVTVSWS